MASVFKKMRDRVSGTTKKFTEKIDHLLYYKELDEDDKETVRDMVRIMRERRAKKQEK